MGSSEYRNVLVQASILDAMSDENYFSSIIHKYPHTGEKLIVYMDMNGTILSSDTILGLSPAQLLLDAMCGIVQVRPRDTFDFTWRDQTTSVRLEKSQTLRKLMSQLSSGKAELSTLFT